MARASTARLFVALDPPPEICEQLIAWVRAALRSTRATIAPRVLDPETLHLTLCFLGNRPIGELDALAKQLVSCTGAVGQLSIGAPLWLPARQPRALAVELHDDAHELARLQANVIDSLAQVSVWQSDGHSASHKRFHPHVTLARLQRGTAPSERALPPTPSLSFTPRELVLYRSWLAPEGASYEAVASRTLTN